MSTSNMTNIHIEENVQGFYKLTIRKRKEDEFLMKTRPQRLEMQEDMQWHHV